MLKYCYGYFFAITIIFVLFSKVRYWFFNSTELFIFDIRYFCNYNYVVKIEAIIEDKIHNNIEIVIKVINEAYFYNKTIKTNKML